VKLNHVRLMQERTNLRSFKLLLWILVYNGYLVLNKHIGSDNGELEVYLFEIRVFVILNDLYDVMSQM